MISFRQIGEYCRYGLVVAVLSVSGFTTALAGPDDSKIVQKQIPEFLAKDVQPEIFAEEFKTFFADAETRIPGSSGNLLIEEKIADIFRKSGLEHGEIGFTAPVFMPGKTSASLATGETIALHPMHPSLFRPGNFKEKSFDTSLVYLGSGNNEDLERIKGENLDGAIAVMDIDARWARLLKFGVRGFIFLGHESMSRDDALSKIYATETSIPRFYVDADEAVLLKKALLEGSVSAKIDAEPSTWKTQYLRDLWVFIPGADENLSKEVGIMLAPIDSNCIVPELASGAQSAANLYLLMNLFEKYKANPPARSTLIVAVNAHTQRFLGERMLAWALFGDLESIRHVLHTDMRVSQIYLNCYSELDLTEFNTDAEKKLQELRIKMDDTTERNIMVKAPVVTMSKHDMNMRKMEILALTRKKDEMSPEEFDRQLAVLETERDAFIKVLTLFNKVGTQTDLHELTENEFDILRKYVGEIIETHSKFLKLNAQSLELDIKNAGIRDTLHGRRVAFVIGLGLDFTSREIGFAVGASQSQGQWSIGWGDNTMRIASELEQVKGAGYSNLLVNTLTMQGGMSEVYYFRNTGRYKSFRDYFYSANQTPAFSIGNVFSSGGRAFLPTDTFENIDSSVLAETASFLSDFLCALWSDPVVTLQSELPASKISGYTPIWSVVAKTMKFDELASSSVVPDLPVGDTAITLLNAPDTIVDGDVCAAYTALTDARGTAVFYGLTESMLASQAFQFDDDFTKVAHAIDAGERNLKVNSDLSPGAAYKILPMFDCVEFSLPAMYDSSRIPLPVAVGSFIPLSSRGDSPPRVYGVSGIKSDVSTKLTLGDGLPSASLFVKDNERVKILTKDKRTLLNPTEEEPEGVGYASSSEVGSDVFAKIARDMSVLNHARINRLRDVANDLAKYFVQRGDEAIEKMTAALEEGDHIGYLRHLYEAVGAQVKSYEQSKATIDDMLKAVVVYMALLLPFCFFVQKLIFNFVKIESQMGAFAGLFILTFIVFRLIHPAFRVAQAAEAIFVAFIMGSLGLFVINILRGRFETEMQILFRNFSVTGTDEVDYSTVGQKAMLIGVNNMKRRRVRTTLTTATIVLVAFTMLSFTSISKKVNPTIIARGKSVPYTGFMYHLPGNFFLDEPAFDIFSTMFHGKGVIALRRWLTPDQANAPEPFHIKCNNGKEINVDAVLGLSVNEDNFIDEIPLVAGRFFSSDNAKEAVIAASLADSLGIDPDNLENCSLVFKGVDLKVSGIVDDEAFRMMRDLDNSPILPIKQISTEGSDTASKQQEVEEMLMSMDGGMDDGGGILFYVDMSALLMVPLNTSQQFGAKPYSVSVKLSAGEKIWPMMDTLLTATKAKFYISSIKPFAADEEGKNEIPAGIYYVGSNYKTSIGGLAVLIIPLLITSTIILNTMLGSVYERKKEIAVYNAIGLNPHHIGMFFLAESFVYGVIGAVGGYLIGQLLSIFINTFGIVEGINLNYSSMSVAYVIIFTVAVVVLSTIYPAVVATKAAVPSGKRKWALPPHDGNRMAVVFPFIYHPKLAIGLMAYLHEYFQAFTEASFGDLIAEELDHSCGVDAKGRKTYNIQYHLTLVPFDLGVTQNADFTLSYNDLVQAYQLEMVLTRVSGQDSNWVTTNKPFLERMRKYLMRWRNLDVSKHMLYVKQAEEFFGEN